MSAFQVRISEARCPTGPTIVETVWEADGRIYGGNPDDPDAPVFEVINLDAAIAGRM